MFGSQSDTQMPLSPYCLNERLLGINELFAVPMAVMTLPNDSGIGWPASFSSVGFGSNRSRWLGPPSMNSQITDLARAGKCGGRGASGFNGSILMFAARARRASRPSREPNARPPNPPPHLVRKARREGAGTRG